MEAGLAKGQAEARLLASRLDGRPRQRRPRRVWALGFPNTRTSWRRRRSLERAGQPLPGGIAELTACSVCGHGAWTPVCEFNRFFLSETVAGR